jgi:hypothetical protein
MKLRITKGRVACAVVLLPVLWVLNLGPLIFCHERFGMPPMWFIDGIYHPFDNALSDANSARLHNYAHWWAQLAWGFPDETKD